MSEQTGDLQPPTVCTSPETTMGSPTMKPSTNGKGSNTTHIISKSFTYFFIALLLYSFISLIVLLFILLLKIYICLKVRNHCPNNNLMFWTALPQKLTPYLNIEPDDDLNYSEDSISKPQESI